MVAALAEISDFFAMAGGGGSGAAVVFTIAADTVSGVLRSVNVCAETVGFCSGAGIFVTSGSTFGLMGSAMGCSRERLTALTFSVAPTAGTAVSTQPVATTSEPV